MTLRLGPLLLLAVLLALAAGCPARTDPRCPDGQADCGGACRDLQSDPAACGACGHACPAGAACSAGACACPAAAPTVCGASGASPGACVDLQTDRFHCGGCATSCGDPALGSCVAGACACDAGAGATTCPDDLGARCVDLASDTGNCGACRSPCASGERCVDPDGNGLGACACVAPEHLSCGGRCLDVRTDEANCGACGALCPSGATCQPTGSDPAGACQCPVSRPTACGTAPGACVDLATDRENCKTCGNRCQVGATCETTGCRCPATAPDTCGATASSPGACVDRQTDEANCGACGRACAGTCLAGACCASPRHACLSECCAGGDGCCAGTGACPQGRSVGLPPASDPAAPNATYFTCSAPGTLDLANAQLAALAWSPTGTAVTTGLAFACGDGCFGWQTPTSCAVWCTSASNFPGQVFLETIQNVCLCNSPRGAWGGATP